MAGAPLPLDLARCPLSGANLIEASAGTGKTYAIAALFLRLIVEDNVPVEKILVVTFTRAATAELKERLFAVLLQARDVLLGRIMCEDEAHLVYLRDHLALEPREKLARLRRALRDFDECAIYTIHGFCQRQLAESAFSGAMLYESEVVTDLAPLTMEALRDFWRSVIYKQPAPVAERIVKQGIDGFQRLCALVQRNPELRIETGCARVAENEELDAARRKVVDMLEELRRLWPPSPEQVVEWLQLERKVLPARRFRRDWMEKAARRIDARLQQGDGDVVGELRDDLERFSARRMQEAATQPESAPRHPLFTLVDRLLDAWEGFDHLLRCHLIALHGIMLATVQQGLEERKRADNVMSFNDFLVRLHAALRAESENGALARSIRGRFDAALIDEFQDTDGLQYAIFQSLFAERHALFLIGDPKQAIYSFRGADLYAYLRAARHVDRSYTLPENYRSDPLLVQGVNAFFSCRPAPFVEPAIAFHEVRPARREASLLIDGEMSRPPFVLWSGGDGEEGVKLSSTAAQEMIRRAVLLEIRRLLRLAQEGRAVIVEEKTRRPLRPSDFAILVRATRQMEPLRQLLADHGIPAVVSSSSSIFDSDEAASMELLLATLAAPAQRKEVCSSLATPLFGEDAARLAAAGDNGTLWESWHLAFRRYGEIVAERGFLAMFRVLLSEWDVKARLLACRRGERQLTNYLHLAEILHLRQEKGGLGVNELRDWLCSMRHEPRLREEEMELRMESDDEAVRIVTIHKSKGLEYPIVFVPFIWWRSESNGQLCHDDAGNMLLLLDDEDSSQMAPRSFCESLAENVRLLYVALTRARQRCYTFWGKFDGYAGAHASAPAYLFHLDEELSPQAPDEQMRKAYGRYEDDKAVRARLEQLFAARADCVEISSLPCDPAPVEHFSLRGSAPRLSAREFKGEVGASRRVTSFTGLTRLAQGEGDEARDLDALPQSAPLDAAPFSLFAFPRGARAGIFMHELLEHADFRDVAGTAAGELIDNLLRRHGFDQAFAPALALMLRRVTRQPLDGYTLSTIGPQQRANELAFFFPLKMVSPEDLARLFRKGACPALYGDQSERLSFAPCQGYMQGFIDLVFCHDERYYLVDWKSNHLGDSLHDYDRSAIEQAMGKGFYFLQYHLYALALHLHLGARLRGYDYERHFGGVYYFFLRGIDPGEGEGTGLFFDRPAHDMILALEELLLPSV